MSSDQIEIFEKARFDYEINQETYVSLNLKYGISTYLLKKCSNLENWERLHHLPIPSEIKKSGVLSSIGIHKIGEIIQELGDKYTSTLDIQISMLAINYQKWLHIETKMAASGSDGHIAYNSKGGEVMSIDFLAVQKIQTAIKDLSSELGISLISKQKLDMKPKPDTDIPNLLDLLDDADTGL